MILEETKDILTSLESLSRTPKQTMKDCIKQTLVKSTITYNNTLQEAQDYLLTRNPMKVLKTITKEQKKEDKKKNEQDN
jgi:hypothetical protein